ncbi:S-adenosyl-L-methionine-dependent methyltransferase [Tirmania nivea]|nr:S-adenosyl-L-methionine-dependent methyltransferase [Tirmania nivea]
MSGYLEFLEKDVVLLRPVKDSERSFLSFPLERGQAVQTHQGAIKHDDIISKSVREVVSSSKGILFRVHWPSTDEYVTKVRRLVTPIYPQDAATIVSLLDLHVSPPPHPEDKSPRPPPLEILEAGTGHGSLTIALAKAIHAANPPQPPSPPSPPLPLPSKAQPTPTPTGSPVTRTPDPRNAIIHTLDVSSLHSSHAKTVIANFRRGMYLPHINFHTGTPSTFLESQLAQRSGTSTPLPFLSIILLDLPSPELYLKISQQAMHSDGLLGIFCPSITQIADVVKVIKQQKLQFALERCVELPNNGGVRSWDVKMVKVRNQQSGEEVGEDAGEGAVDVGDGLKMVCRPKVGGMVVGGGFFALLRRLDIVHRNKEGSAEEEGKPLKGIEKSAVQEEIPAEGGVRAWIRKYLGF